MHLIVYCEENDIMTRMMMMRMKLESVNIFTFTPVKGKMEQGGHKFSFLWDGLIVENITSIYDH